MKTNKHGNHDHNEAAILNRRNLLTAGAAGIAGAAAVSHGIGQSATAASSKDAYTDPANPGLPKVDMEIEPGRTAVQRHVDSGLGADEESVLHAWMLPDDVDGRLRQVVRDVYEGVAAVCGHEHERVAHVLTVARERDERRVVVQSRHRRHGAQRHRERRRHRADERASPNLQLDLDGLPLHGRARGDPVIGVMPAVYACAACAAACWLLSLLTDEHGWIDRLWSIAPVGYAVWFAAAGGFTLRGIVMAACVAAWGLRLTWNFMCPDGSTKSQVACTQDADHASYSSSF